MATRRTTSDFTDETAAALSRKVDGLLVATVAAPGGPLDAFMAWTRDESESRSDVSFADVYRARNVAPDGVPGDGESMVPTVRRDSSAPYTPPAHAQEEEPPPPSVEKESGPIAKANNFTVNPLGAVLGGLNLTYTRALGDTFSIGFLLQVTVPLLMPATGIGGGIELFLWPRLLERQRSQVVLL